MNASLPPLPDLPWTATQWAARHVSNLLNTPDFVHWSVAWGRLGRPQEADLLAELHRRARAQGAGATPTLAELHRAAAAVVASAGGQAAAPVLSFHLHFAFVQHCVRTYPSLAGNPAAQAEWGVLLQKTGATAQRSALVAVSQRLGCPCGGLGVWRTGMLKGRARPVRKAPATAPLQPVQ